MGWTACSKQGELSNFGRIEGYPQLKVVNLKQEVPGERNLVKPGETCLVESCEKMSICLDQD